MPRNFDSPLEINDHGCITPAGPLDLAPGETPKRLDVWVWQENSACAAIATEFKDGKWKAITNPDEDHTGAGFKEGPATAMALLVSETNEGTKTFQWTEGILLKLPTGGQVSPDHTH